MAEALFGSSLLNASGEKVPTASIGAVDAILVYFSAHWCGPCRGFTPKLAKSYKQMKEAGKNFELIFVSSDKTQEAFNEYFSEMPWMALPFEDRDTKNKLSKKFKVRGIPSLVVLDGAGNLITDDGRSKVSEDPAGDKFPWIPPSFDECLGSVFVDNKKKEYGLDYLEGKVIGLYFSAHWCPPCRGFTPKLVELYNKLKAEGKNFEIIFCSSDRDEESFGEYFGEMPWLALPFSERGRKADLSSRFGVEGIPTLVILEGTSGKVITTNGRGAVEDPDGFPWYPKPINSVSTGASDLNDTSGLVVFVKDAAEEQRIQDILRPFAEQDIASNKEGDNPLVFITCQEDASLTPRLKTFMKWSDVGAGVTVGILSIPDQGSFHSQITDVSADAVAQFVNDWRQGKLEKLPL
jgi:nucleoredoxin